MVPFMCDDLKNLVEGIPQLYIKQSVIDNCSNGTACKYIDLLNKSNIVSKRTKKLTLGCYTELAIVEPVKKDIAASVFKTECVTFLITTTEKISECSPLGFLG